MSKDKKIQAYVSDRVYQKILEYQHEYKLKSISLAASQLLERLFELEDEQEALPPTSDYLVNKITQEVLSRLPTREELEGLAKEAYSISQENPLYWEVQKLRDEIEYLKRLITPSTDSVNSISDSVTDSVETEIEDDTPSTDSVNSISDSVTDSVETEIEDDTPSTDSVNSISDSVTDSVISQQDLIFYLQDLFKYSINANMLKKLEAGDKLGSKQVQIKEHLLGNFVRVDNSTWRRV